PLGELREEAARTKAAALPDAEARHRKIHEERSLRDWTDEDGTWRLSANGTPDAGAKIMARLRTIADLFFKKAPAEGSPEPTEAYLFDALLELATGGEAANKSSADTTVLGRVDYEAMFLGQAGGGELAETAGFGLVLASV